MKKSKAIRSSWFKTCLSKHPEEKGDVNTTLCDTYSEPGDFDIGDIIEYSNGYAAGDGLYGTGCTIGKYTVIGRSRNSNGRIRYTLKDTEYDRGILYDQYKTNDYEDSVIREFASQLAGRGDVDVEVLEKISHIIEENPDLLLSCGYGLEDILRCKSVGYHRISMSLLSKSGKTAYDK